MIASFFDDYKDHAGSETHNCKVAFPEQRPSAT